MKWFLAPAVAGFLFVAPALADTAPGEVVAVVKGKTYTYSELEPTSDRRETLKKYNKGDEFEKALRSSAASNLRETAARNILAGKSPDCDLVATDEEIVTFVAWWQKNAQEILDAQIAQAESMGRKVQVTGPWANLDEINPGNERVAAAAREKIETWKLNKCIYQTYGGGRVHENLGVLGFMTPGETIVSAHESLAGYPYPVVVSAGTPLNGYIAFFEVAKADGSISFPDARYEEAFFSYYRNEKLRSFAAEAEEASIVTRYWEHPVVLPKP